MKMNEDKGRRRATAPLTRSSRRGISLVLVVSIMLILAVVSTGFAAFTAQDMRASQNNYEQNECYFLAESGVDYGLFLIKHNMMVFPAPPVTHTGVTPVTASTYTSNWVDGRSASVALDNSDSDTATGVTHGSIAGRTGLDLPGSLVNLASGYAREQVVVSDLGYNPTNNWMSEVKTCGTFVVNHTVTGTGPTYTVKLTSTGYIRQIPEGVTTTSLTAYNAVSSWAIIAQRTVIAQVDVTVPSAGGTSFANQPSLLVKDYYEKFR